MMRINYQGFSLVELLVSILVLTVGVLCAAAMQLLALRTTQESGYQTTALQLASEIAEQLRSLRIQEQYSENHFVFTGLEYKSESEPEKARTNCMSGVVHCQIAELIQFEVAGWEKKIKAEFPGGRLEICRDAKFLDDANGSYRWGCAGAQSDGNQLLVKIGWRHRSNDNQSMQTTTETMAPLVVVAVGV